jgi:hypothetical protein
MSQAKQGSWQFLFVGSHHDERKEKLLGYVVHRMKAGAHLGDVVEEEYVRRNASKEEVDDLIRDPELAHAAREHLESALESEAPYPRPP